MFEYAMFFIGGMTPARPVRSIGPVQEKIGQLEEDFPGL